MKTLFTKRRARTRQTPPHITALWLRYARTRSVRLRNLLVEHFVPLAHEITHRAAKALPRHVDEGELRSDAMVGLINAVERFEPARGLRFETYCHTRIRGAILDAIRDRDWVPRLTRNRSKRITDAADRLKDELGRNPSEAELRRKLGMSADQFRQFYRDRVVVAHSLNLTFANRNGRDEVLWYADPHEVRDTVANADAVEQILSLLDDGDRRIMELYHLSELTMREVGERLGVSESAVSQRYRRIMAFLHARFRRVADFAGAA